MRLMKVYFFHNHRQERTLCETAYAIPVTTMEKISIQCWQSKLAYLDKMCNLVHVVLASEAYHSYNSDSSGYIKAR